jgi:hypothetical protein
MAMLETQIDHWTKVPLVTNTQPDYSSVGNSDMLEIRSCNWLGTDTIFVENIRTRSVLARNRQCRVAHLRRVHCTRMRFL